MAREPKVGAVVYVPWGIDEIIPAKVLEVWGDPPAQIRVELEIEGDEPAVILLSPSILVDRPNDRDVVSDAHGGWDVRVRGSSRVSSHHATKADAVRRAREIVSNAGGGEVIVHGRDGRIQAKDTIASGNDTFPPRDRS